MITSKTICTMVPNRYRSRDTSETKTNLINKVALGTNSMGRMKRTMEATVVVMMIVAVVIMMMRTTEKSLMFYRRGRTKKTDRSTI